MGGEGNPGPAGAGVFITDADGKVLKEVSKFLGHQTNNFAEYEAVIIALEEAKKLIPKEKRKTAEIEVRMDSELVQRQLLGNIRSKSRLFSLNL